MNYKAPNLHQCRDVLTALIETYRMPVLFLTETKHIWLKNKAMERFILNNELFDEFNNKIKWKDFGKEIGKDNDKQYGEILSQIFSADQTQSNVVNKNLKNSIEIEKGKYAVITSLSTHKEPSSAKNYKPVKVAVLYIFDYQRYEAPNQACFNQMFGFNKTEAHVCQLLIKNYSIKEMCVHKKITENTGREYVKRVYQKTGCKNLFELLNLICSIPLHHSH